MCIHVQYLEYCIGIKEDRKPYNYIRYNVAYSEGEVWLLHKKCSKCHGMRNLASQAETGYNHVQSIQWLLAHTGFVLNSSFVVTESEVLDLHNL